AEAKAQFQRALQLDPTMAEAHYQLAMTFINEGNVAEAVKALEQYLTLAPNGPNAQMAKDMLPEPKKMMEVPAPADNAATLGSVRRRIAAAAQRANRPPSDITLIAVSKTFSADDVRAATVVGHLAFGENRVQEAEAKRASLEDVAIEWHLIGHLQSNKARKAVTTSDCIKSLDRTDLLRQIVAADRDAGRSPHIII